MVYSTTPPIINGHFCIQHRLRICWRTTITPAHSSSESGCTWKSRGIPHQCRQSPWRSLLLYLWSTSTLKYLDVIDRVNMESSLCESSHQRYLLSMLDLCVFVHWGQIHFVLVVGVIGVDCCEFDNEGTVILEVWLLYKLCLQGRDVCLHGLVVGDERECEFSKWLELLPVGMFLPDAKLDIDVLGCCDEIDGGDD